MSDPYAPSLRFGDRVEILQPAEWPDPTSWPDGCVHPQDLPGIGEAVIATWGEETTLILLGDVAEDFTGGLSDPMPDVPTWRVPTSILRRAPDTDDPGFVPYTEGGKLAAPVALVEEWLVEPIMMGRTRHCLMAADDPDNVILMMEVRPGVTMPGRVEWHCSPPGPEHEDRGYASGTVPAPIGEIDAAIVEGRRLAHESYDRWSREQMARIAASALAVPHG